MGEDMELEARREEEGFVPEADPRADDVMSLSDLMMLDPLGMTERQLDQLVDALRVQRHVFNAEGARAALAKQKGKKGKAGEAAESTPEGGSDEG